MALDELEAAKAYDALSRMMQEASLPWVVEQTADRIRQGRMDQKRIESFEESRGAAGASQLRRSRRKELRVSIVPYTAQEKLSILVDAVDQAVVVVNQLEEADLAWAARENRPNVKFMPDPEAGEPESEAEVSRRELHLDRVRADERGPSNEKLKMLLAELRHELPKVE